MTLPVPYDADAYRPVGTLSSAEDRWATHLKAAQQQVLGWQIAGRDQAGDLVAVCTLSCGTASQFVRDCYVTLTAGGHVYRSRERTP